MLHQGTKGGLFSQQLLHSSTYGVPKERASNAKENNRLVREIFLLLLTGMASFSQLVDYNVFAKTQTARQKLISFTDKKGTQHAGWISYVLKILDELARHASDPAKYVGGFSAGKESLPFISWTILEGSLSPLPSVVYSTVAQLFSRASFSGKYSYNKACSGCILRTRAFYSRIEKVLVKRIFTNICWQSSGDA